MAKIEVINSNCGIEKFFIGKDINDCIEKMISFFKIVNLSGCFSKESAKEIGIDFKVVEQ